MAARAAFSPAGSEGVSGLSPDWPDAFASVALSLSLSLSLSATDGRLTAGLGFGWKGTGGWRVSTEAFCTVGVGAPLRAAGAAIGTAGAGAPALFSGAVVVTGRAASVAG